MTWRLALDTWGFIVVSGILAVMYSYYRGLR